MHIAKVNIENFKCYKGKFSIPLNPGANILVGNNEAGKSTILEAIHLALTGILNGRYLKNELSPYLFNRRVEQEYIASLTTANPMSPPHIQIELFGASRNRVGEFEVFSRFRSKLSERGGELRAIARASLRSKVRDVSALFSPDAFV
jgi:ABC-type branched-subunit amino acid transport system ATPase component